MAKKGSFFFVTIFKKKIIVKWFSLFWINAMEHRVMIEFATTPNTHPPPQNNPVVCKEPVFLKF